MKVPAVQAGAWIFNQTFQRPKQCEFRWAIILSICFIIRVLLRKQIRDSALQFSDFLTPSLRETVQDHTWPNSVRYQILSMNNLKDWIKMLNLNRNMLKS